MVEKRKFPLIEGKYYHILNRTIGKTDLFPKESYYHRFILLLRYYRYKDLPYRFSTFMSLSPKQQRKLWNEFKKSEKLVKIITYCCMKTHFHLLLKQEIKNGISNFIGKLSNSYAKFFNNRLDRKGPLFEGRFKSVLIESEEQLLHLSRYIHLNPYSAGAVCNVEDLVNYEYSSFKEYLVKTENQFCDKEIILGYFKNIQKYKEFVVNRGVYQRELQKIKNLTLEN